MGSASQRPAGGIPAGPKRAGHMPSAQAGAAYGWARGLAVGPRRPRAAIANRGRPYLPASFSLACFLQSAMILSSAATSSMVLPFMAVGMGSRPCLIFTNWVPVMS